MGGEFWNVMIWIVATARNGAECPGLAASHAVTWNNLACNGLAASSGLWRLGVDWRGLAARSEMKRCVLAWRRDAIRGVEPCSGGEKRIAVQWPGGEDWSGVLCAGLTARSVAT
ncbi:MAG: hypothetical protein C5B60_05535 [Chloroflexi bacterium]|nr:MAG: hypothetical protein C5B60_05535 [Chloroflexota bacterium]